jgi:hypothetical protein
MLDTVAIDLPYICDTTHSLVVVQTKAAYEQPMYWIESSIACSERGSELLLESPCRALVSQ